MSIFPITKIPLTIPGCMLWLDASDINNGAPNPADNTPISIWRDKSGKGKDISQSTPADQPIFLASYLGKAAVKFDGTMAELTESILTDASYTVFLAYQCPNNSTYQVLFYNGDTGANGYGYLIDSDGNRAILFGGVANKEDGAVSADFEIISNSWDGTTSEMYLNGVFQSISLATQPLVSPFGTFAIGSDGGSNYANAYIREIVIFSPNISSGARQVMTQYLSNKWGIA